MEFQADPVELNDVMEASLGMEDAIFTLPTSNVAEEIVEKMASEFFDAASIVEEAVFDEVVAENIAETINDSIIVEPLLEPVVEELAKQFQQTYETTELHDIVEQNLGAGSEIMKELAEQVQQSAESMELDNVLEEPSLGVEAAAAEMVKESILTAAATNEEMASESVDFVSSAVHQRVFDDVVAEAVNDDEATSSFGKSVIEEITQRVQQTVPMILVISTLILGLLIIAFFVWRRRRSIISSKSSSSLEDEKKEAEAEAEGNAETADASAAQS